MTFWGFAAVEWFSESVMWGSMMMAEGRELAWVVFLGIQRLGLAEHVSGIFFWGGGMLSMGLLVGVKLEVQSKYRGPREIRAATTNSQGINQTPTPEQEGKDKRRNQR